MTNGGSRDSIDETDERRGTLSAYESKSMAGQNERNAAERTHASSAAEEGCGEANLPALPVDFTSLQFVRHHPAFISS
jgi:hypothetical protein